MKKAFIKILDSKATWITVGTIAGLFGDKAADVVSAVGALVMAAI